jgi:hypothetical protein
MEKGSTSVASVDPGVLLCLSERQHNDCPMPMWPGRPIYAMVPAAHAPSQQLAQYPQAQLVWVDELSSHLRGGRGRGRSARAAWPSESARDGEPVLPASKAQPA